MAGFTGGHADIVFQGIYPSGPPKQDGSSNLFEGLENTQLLSLEILLTFVDSMAERLEQVRLSVRITWLRCVFV